MSVRGTRGKNAIAAATGAGHEPLSAAPTVLPGMPTVPPEVRHMPVAVATDPRGFWITTTPQKPGQPKQVVVTFPATLLFDIDRADVRPDAQPALGALLEMFNTTYPTASATIAGYTDNTGTVEHNLGLSLERAQAVAKWLLERGISANRVSVVGHGPDQPVGDNTTTAGRRANRRVEVILTVVQPGR
jgi:outer membrane protein OmpA-like peptidoglycan-associated protein